MKSSFWMLSNLAIIWLTKESASGVKLSYCSLKRPLMISATATLSWMGFIVSRNLSRIALRNARTTCSSYTFSAWQMHFPVVWLLVGHLQIGLLFAFVTWKNRPHSPQISLWENALGFLGNLVLLYSSLFIFTTSCAF